MKIKNFLLSTAYYPLRVKRFFNLFGAPSGAGRLRVLLYHDIAPFERELFASQLKWLGRKWRFITPAIFEGMVAGLIPVDQDSLLLTFDDGFISNREVAETILNPLGIKALFFVVSDFTGIDCLEKSHDFIVKNIYPNLEKSKVPSHWGNMGWDDLRYLLDCGHTIGAHTASHARLTNISTDLLANEIIVSADYLSSRLGINIEHFAYTFGDILGFSERALEIARTRFKYIHTGLRGVNGNISPSWAIRRDSIAPNNPTLMMGALLEGAADPLYKRDLVKYESWGSCPPSL